MDQVSATRNSTRPRNRLLAALLPADLELLQPHLRHVAMKVFKDMERPNRRIDTVYFMEAGIASVVAVQADETRVEVGLIGREGMTGIAVVLGDDQSPHSTYIQVAGDAPDAGHGIAQGNGCKCSLRNSLLKFVQAFMVQTSHTAIANARAHIDRRLARWILMAHDRTCDDTLLLTHEFLALMLGVRRAGVTEALHSLKQQKTNRHRPKSNPRGQPQGHREEGGQFLWRAREGISASYQLKLSFGRHGPLQLAPALNPASKKRTPSNLLLGVSEPVVGRIIKLLFGRRGFGSGTARSALYELGRINSLANQSLACGRRASFADPCLLDEPFVVGSTKWTVGAREEHRRAGKAAPIRFNACCNVSAGGRTFDHQDAHNITSRCGDASWFLRCASLAPNSNCNRKKSGIPLERLGHARLYRFDHASRNLSA